MKLSKDQVKHVGRLANLPLSEEEVEKFTLQLSETLDYVAELDSVDTKGMYPTSQVTGLTNITREDKATPSLTQAAVLQNVKSQHQGYVKVKAILEEES